MKRFEDLKDWLEDNISGLKEAVDDLICSYAGYETGHGGLACEDCPINNICEQDGDAGWCEDFIREHLYDEVDVK